MLGRDTVKSTAVCHSCAKMIIIISFLSLQLGIPHTFMMMSYQYKFQDDDQTKIKGSVKYVVKMQYVLFGKHKITVVGHNLFLV